MVQLISISEGEKEVIDQSENACCICCSVQPLYSYRRHAARYIVPAAGVMDGLDQLAAFLHVFAGFGGGTGLRAPKRQS